MSKVIYRGPHGALIAEGIEFRKDEVTEASDDLIASLRQYEPQHIFEDVPQDKPEPTAEFIGTPITPDENTQDYTD